MNTITEVTEAFGVPFFDMNLYYEEIGLDFSQDFSDPHHVNVQGADKVTKFLAKYLVEEYDLQDHRGEPEYASWDELYEEYRVSVEKAREKLRQKIEEEK